MSRHNIYSSPVANGGEGDTIFSSSHSTVARKAARRTVVTGDTMVVEGAGW